jgi:hypothetical protein
MEASLKSRNSSTSPSQRQKQTKDTRLFDLLNSKRTLKTTVATQLYSVLDWTSRICTHLAFNGEMKNKFGAIQRKTK